MKIYAWISDHLLISRLTQIDGITDVFPIKNENEIIDSSSLLIISDLLVPITKLSYLKSLFNDLPLLYLVSNGGEKSYFDQVETICTLHQINCIYPQNTLEDIASYIEEKFLGRKKEGTKMIAVLSALPQSGSTGICLALANEMGKLTNKKIGVLGLNGWNSGTEYMDYKGKTFDELWGSIYSQKLTDHDLTEKAHKLEGNAFYIAGNKDKIKLFYYNKDGVHFYLEKAKKAFDLVILDIGAYYDSPLAAQGLLQANMHIINTNQLHSSINAFQDQYDQILKKMCRSHVSQMHLLINKYQELDEYYTPSQMSDMFGIPFLASLKYEEEFYKRIQQKTIEGHVSEDYEKNVRKLAKQLLVQHRIPLIENNNGKKRWYHRLLPSKSVM